ncbi:hypothetical protein [Aeromonas phage AS-zj]|uniref:SMI1/KNR4 family protein n=3 Tax=Ceceduovirus TaxID=2842588 RepID=A0A411B8N3_9CAUD|nr:hypothetical protein HWB28_gp077 [Aeromonas phage AS-zj]YP_009835010.1 hypothetical protein HWB29_gp308 [Aeromonas phage AS-sw]QAX97963.1 hypothetical protein ASswx1_321 [Aeromonas phage Asswx_1]QAX98992.1 hypothetical protein assk_201 [Aeromonas phage Assk]ASU00475.1 hypothetical protein [Aeromonas phage AS-zj]ATI18358.1 hypothetical protein [Aeromonas phage AS-sw]
MIFKIGQSYKIVSMFGVAVEHMDCLNDVIVCTDFDEDSGVAWFDGLMWTNFGDRGNYILAMSDEGIENFGTDYGSFLSNVLEEVK